MSLIMARDEELRSVKLEWRELLSEALLTDSRMDVDTLAILMADRFRYEIKLALRREANRLRAKQGRPPL